MPARAIAARVRFAFPCLCAVATAALACGTPVAGAQVVTGIVTEANGRTPVPGAIVSFVQDNRNRIAPALTDESGRFTLRAPEPGVYRVRADAVGFATMHTEPAALGTSDTLRVALALSPRSRALEAVRVTAETSCATDPAGERTAAVWQEIRTALESSAAAERERRTPLALTVTDAILNTRMATVSSSRVTVRSFAGGGFQTASADELAKHGFVRIEGDSIKYFAPDASVLLAEAFLSTHCFSVTERQPLFAGRELGLRFTPVATQKVVEVEGTIWLDGRTAALKRIEVGYTNAPKDAGPVYGKAEIEYQRLPSGRWIVSRWWLRIPRLSATTREGLASGNIYLTGYRERRGEARVLAAAEVARDPQPAVLIGLAFDSTTGAPMTNAIARFASFDARADENGLFGFQLQNPAAIPTPHRVRVWHPRLARLGLDTLRRDFELQPGDTVRAHFTVPSLATLRGQLCPRLADTTAAAPPLPGTGIVIGVVRRADTTASGALEARVEATWWVDEAGRPQPAPTRARHSVVVLTNDSGRYAFCGLPLGVPVTLRAQAASALVSEPVDVTLADGWLGEEDLVLPPARAP